MQWTNDDQSDIMTLHYPSISLHAVSRDLSTFPHPCLYILYCPLDTDDENDDDDDPDEEGSAIEKITEIRFVPSSPDQCKFITLYFHFVYLFFSGWNVRCYLRVSNAISRSRTLFG